MRATRGRQQRRRNRVNKSSKGSAPRSKPAEQWRTVCAKRARVSARPDTSLQAPEGRTGRTEARVVGVGSLGGTAPPLSAAVAAAAVVESGVGCGRRRRRRRWRIGDRPKRRERKAAAVAFSSGRQASRQVAAERRGGVVGPGVPSPLRRWRLAGLTVTVPCG